MCELKLMLKDELNCIMSCLNCDYYGDEIRRKLGLEKEDDDGKDK